MVRKYVLVIKKTAYTGTHGYTKQKAEKLAKIAGGSIRLLKKGKPKK